MKRVESADALAIIIIVISDDIGKNNERHISNTYASKR